MIDIEAWVNVEMGTDNLSCLLGRRRFNHHCALLNDGFHSFEYYFELRQGAGSFAGKPGNIKVTAQCLCRPVGRMTISDCALFSVDVCYEFAGASPYWLSVKGRPHEKIGALRFYYRSEESIVRVS
jgi:hypothetical protein